MWGQAVQVPKPVKRWNGAWANIPSPHKQENQLPVRLFPGTIFFLYPRGTVDERPRPRKAGSARLRRRFCPDFAPVRRRSSIPRLDATPSAGRGAGRIFRPWTFRIASRIAFSHLKHARRWQPLDDAPPEHLAALNPCLGEPPDEAFLTLLDHVSPASRAVLLLRYQHDLKLEESAAILEIPIGTAKSRLHYESPPFANT